jgi:hypothetical protein
VGVVTLLVAEAAEGVLVGVPSAVDAMAADDITVAVITVVAGDGVGEDWVYGVTATAILTIRITLTLIMMMSRPQPCM